MPTTKEEAATAKGRYCRVNQATCGSKPGECPPFWYGQIVDVSLDGGYLKFSPGNGRAPRWYHRNDVHLHELKP